MSPARRLLISGATGKQGGALISALLSKPAQSFELYAITRNKDSKASKLLEKQNVRLIEGNLDNVDALFTQIPKPVWGVFSVPILDKGIKKEEKQGADLTRAAVEAGTSHIIFTSTERGGQDQSENDPTEVPHFASKYRTEQDIKSAVASSNGHMTYTFLRPVAFFENMPNGFLGRAFVSMWRLNGPDRKLQMISSKDIGKVAADAFLNASSDEYRNKSISLASDSLTPTDAARIFRDETGLAIPATYTWLGWLIRTLVPDLRHMFHWLKVVGSGTDVPALRKRYPFMMDFRAWLREESDWSKKKTA
jgi:uncharacterized protein YbjT (DUF2867 family)